MLGTSRVVATLLASILIASPALAQPGAPPTQQQKQDAGELVKQAITKSQAKDHDGAIELYLKAYQIIPLAQLLSNIGTEYQNAQKPVEALKYFCMYLEKEPTGNLAGYAISQGKALYFQLGNKTVTDKDVCKVPVTPPVTTVVEEKQPPPPPPPPAAEDPGKTMKIVGYAAGGVGLVALGVGLFFGSEAQKISDDISSHTDPTIPWRDDIKAYEAKGQRDENLQITFLVIGGVFVIGGTAAYLLGRSKTSSAERMALRPTANANGAGLVLSGSF